MSTGFDPYHAWLGCPPGTRPSNHYELLGLKLFQSEPPIIAEAADEWIAKVERQLQGPYAAMAQQLLDQLNAARAELLSPATKRNYDAQLRTQLGMPPAAEVRPPTPATVRHSAPTMVAPMAAQPVAPATPIPPAAAPLMPPAVPMAAVPVAAVPMAAMPSVPVAPMAATAIPMAAVPLGMPQGAPMMAQGGAMMAQPGVMMPQAVPMMAQAVPMMAQAVPMMAQTVPVMQGYAPGMVAPQPAMAGLGYGESTADGSLEDIESRRRRRRQSYGSQIVLVVALVVVVGLLVGVGVMYRETLLEALENKPQTVIVEGEHAKPPEPATKPSTPTKTATPATRPEPAKPAMPDQLASNVVEPPKMDKPKSSTPKKPGPTAKSPTKSTGKPKMSASAGSAVSIRPLSPEEKATVGESLKNARKALGDRNQAKVEEQLNLAMLEASSAESMAAINHMRTLQEAVHEFWHAVRESSKGLKPVDELEIDGKKMVVVNADAEQLSVRADGKLSEYKIEKLPTNMAMYLARQWLRKNDPTSSLVMGAFLLVDPKGDHNRVRKLLEDAANGGLENAKILLAQDTADAK